MMNNEDGRASEDHGQILSRGIRRRTGLMSHNAPVVHERRASDEVLDIMELIAKEGRTARNVINWSVKPNLTPVNSESDANSVGGNGDPEGEFTTVMRRGSKNLKQSSLKESYNGANRYRRQNEGKIKQHRNYRDQKSGGKRSKKNKEKLSNGQKGQKVKSKSPTRTKKKLGVHARYWSYLSSNLIRAVDEIYETCEVDQSQLQCEEVIGVLNTAQEDFNELINRFAIHSAFEKAIDDGSKPTSLAWSVRKISPLHGAASPLQRPVPFTNPYNSATFPSFPSSPSGHKESIRKIDIDHNIQSYADRVKGSENGELYHQRNRQSYNVSADSDGHVPELMYRSQEEESDPDENGIPIGHSESSPGVSPAPMHVPGVEPIPFVDGDDDVVISNRATSPFRWADATDTDTAGSILEDSMPEYGEHYAVSPGGSVLLHQKLSSPFRKRSVAEYTRISNEKQLRASKAREKLHEDISGRLRKQNTAKIQAAQDRRETKGKRTSAVIEEKMQRAVELRDSHLKEKKKKAQIEDAKIHEIAFINKLEEENKKLQANDKLNESQERLNELEEERQRRVLAQAAKQDAAQQRREAMETERLAKIKQQEIKRLAREEEILNQRKRAAEERSAKQSDSEKRKSTGTTKDIQYKGSPMKSRKETNQVEHGSPGRKRSSSESKSSVQSTPAPLKLPPLQQGAKKRLKRIRKRFESIKDAALDSSKSREGFSGSSRSSISKIICKLLGSFIVKDGITDKVGAANIFENSVSRLQKVLQERGQKLHIEERLLICRTIATVFSVISSLEPADCGYISAKSIRIAIEVILHSAEPSAKMEDVYQQAMIPEGRMFGIIDLTVECLQNRCSEDISREASAKSTLLTARMLRSILKSDMSGISSICPGISNLDQIHDDTILYCTANSLLESIKAFFIWLSPTLLDSEGCTYRIVENCLEIVIALSNPDAKRKRRPAHSVLMGTAKGTELMGISTLLYAIVMHCGQRRQPAAMKISPGIARLVLLGLRALNQLAALDRIMFQEAIGIDPAGLLLCHVLARLIGFSVQADVNGTNIEYSGILHEAIILAGEFTLGSPKNQEMIHAGGSATILPTLCSLPFKYFSDPQYMEVLFPTLLASCFQCERNREVLAKEINFTLIRKFIEDKMAETPGVGNKTLDSGRFDCNRRFPRDSLPVALEFFIG